MSVDDATLVFEKATSEFRIDAKAEFWGHCSNLHAWYENGYDTRLLHHSLAFYLLYELTKAEDPIAKQVFKEEIAKRYAYGDPSIQEYLREEGYLKFLSEEELTSIL